MRWLVWIWGRAWRSRIGPASRWRRWKAPMRCCVARRRWWKGKRLSLVKASARRRHLLFDVPAMGPNTIDVMVETGTTALAVDAGRTLLIDRDEMLAKANAAEIAIVGMEALGMICRVAVVGAGAFRAESCARCRRESAGATDCMLWIPIGPRAQGAECTGLPGLR